MKRADQTAILCWSHHCALTFRYTLAHENGEGGKLTAPSRFPLCWPDRTSGVAPIIQISTLSSFFREVSTSGSGATVPSFKNRWHITGHLEAGKKECWPSVSWIVPQELEMKSFKRAPKFNRLPQLNVGIMYPDKLGCVQLLSPRRIYRYAQLYTFFALKLPRRHLLVDISVSRFVCLLWNTNPSWNDYFVNINHVLVLGIAIIRSFWPVLSHRPGTIQ